ncbi:MAG: hypothetical protein ACK5ZP_07130, partial [Betaproteobacteria bacterium]
MSFTALAPGLSLALLAAVAAAVLGLYLLRPPPRRVVVASRLIWARVLARQQRQSEPWRWWLSLALALAIGLALTAAALRPEPGAAGAPRRRSVVLDTAPTRAPLRADGRSFLWRVGIDNVLDKRYWREAPTQYWGGTYLFPAYP